MSARALPELESSISADDFHALEEKIYKTIELLKSAREAKAIAERDAARFREQLEEREEQVELLKGQVVALRREREEVRGRVEKILKQIDSITEDSH
jgi:chromosome segregation ATPase